MKIMLDGREFVRGRETGIGRFLENLMRAAVPGSRHEFALLLNQECEYRGSVKGLRTVTIHQKSAFAADQFTIPAAIRKEGIDVFFSPFYKCPVLTGARRIITIHDLTYFILKDAPEYGNYAFKLWHRIMAGGADKIVTVSNNTKKDIVRVLGIKPEKISVAYNCVAEEFSPAAAGRAGAAAGKYGIHGAYLLYAGNSRPHKNLPRLVEAYGALPEKLRKEYGLVLAGADPEDLRGLPMEGVTAVRRVEPEDLAPLYAGASLFVFPSLYEGFGFPPLEAMACGCPVASSDRSCMPEILGEACEYFDPYDVKDISDKVRSLLENEGLRKALSARGIERAAFFRPEKRNRDMAGVFEGL